MDITPILMPANMTYKQKLEYYQRTYNAKEEYIDKDGIIRCKKCNHPRLYISPDKEWVNRCACACLTEKYEKEAKELAILKKRQYLKERRENALLGGTYELATFDNTKLDDADQSFYTAFLRCKKYTSIAEEAKAKGYGMYIYGSYGVGKSHLTACIANELLNKGYNLLYTNIINIMNEITDSYKSAVKESEVLQKYSNIDFLFIDDFGTEKLTDKYQKDSWKQEKIYDILNARLINAKPTLLTSNHSIGELVREKGLNPKIAERLVELATAQIELKGTSFRIKKAKGNNSPF